MASHATDVVNKLIQLAQTQQQTIQQLQQQSQQNTGNADATVDAATLQSADQFLASNPAPTPAPAGTSPSPSSPAGTSAPPQSGALPAGATAAATAPSGVTAATGTFPPTGATPGAVPPAAGATQPATGNSLTAINTPQGQVLATPDGKALYTNAGGPQDVAKWPPYIVPNVPTGLPGLNVTQTASGQQATYNGNPLFTFSGDQPGQVNGQGQPGWQPVVVGTVTNP